MRGLGHRDERIVDGRALAGIVPGLSQGPRGREIREALAGAVSGRIRPGSSGQGRSHRLARADRRFRLGLRAAGGGAQ